MIGEPVKKGLSPTIQLNTVLRPISKFWSRSEDVMADVVRNGHQRDRRAKKPEEKDARVAPKLPPTESTRECGAVRWHVRKLDRTDDPVRNYLREMGSVDC